MPTAFDPAKNTTLLTIAFLVAGALLSVYGCVSLLDGFSVGAMGMLMLGSGLCVLGLVRWKVLRDAPRLVKD